MSKGPALMQLESLPGLESASAQAPSGNEQNVLVLTRCRQAEQLAESGEYQAACSLLVDWWRRVDERPRTDGLDDNAQAELLLRAGALAGWLSDAGQAEGAQDFAKDLISESARIFERLEIADKVVEARIDLALCYYREGALDEARVTLAEVLLQLGQRPSEQRLRALANLGLVNLAAGRLRDALRVHQEAAPLFDQSANHILRGNFHQGYANLLDQLGAAEHTVEYSEHVLAEYTAAAFHYEQAGHLRLLALMENKLGELALKNGRFIEAHQHFNRARALQVKQKNKSEIARVDEMRARTFLAQGLSAQAEAAARASVRVLEQGGEPPSLANALITQSVAMARLGRFERAQSQLKRAMEIAGDAGDAERAGSAALAIVEELAAYLPTAALCDYYSKAEALLGESESPGIADRLGQCARSLLATEELRRDEFKDLDWLEPGKLPPIEDADVVEETIDPVLAEEDWTTCSLETEVLRYERDMIQRALEATGGSVTRAARMLGLTHQGLAFILNGRHRTLLTVRTPVRRRRKSIFRNH
jgi:tetratricopeptide (TPR) repeat protein